MTLDELLEKTQEAIDTPGRVAVYAPGRLGAAVEFLVNAAPLLVEAIRDLRTELVEERSELPDPEWDRIEKLSDDEVQAELIADGVYKDEADIAEQAAKFTLRVHEMLRMKKAGERIGREKLAQTERLLAEFVELVSGAAPLAWLHNPNTMDHAHEWEKRAAGLLEAFHAATKCRWCALPMAPRRICRHAPPDYDETAELVPNYCEAAQAKEQGLGTLEVGTNERGEVVVNLDRDRTGHIVFSAREALEFARTLLKMSERARQEFKR